MIVRLLLLTLVVIGCSSGGGAVAESAWIENNSSSPVVVVIDDIGGFEVAAGASGPVYATEKQAHAIGRRVRIATSPRCETLGMQLNARRTLLITVGADATIQFQQGADFSGRPARGSIQPTAQCQV